VRNANGTEWARVLLDTRRTTEEFPDAADSAGQVRASGLVALPLSVPPGSGQEVCKESEGIATG